MEEFNKQEAVKQGMALLSKRNSTADDLSRLRSSGVLLDEDRWVLNCVIHDGGRESSHFPHWERHPEEMQKYYFNIAASRTQFYIKLAELILDKYNYMTMLGLVQQ